MAGGGVEAGGATMDARARPWQAHGQTGMTGLISNGYAGVRVARKEVPGG